MRIVMIELQYVIVSAIEIYLEMSVSTTSVL